MPPDQVRILLADDDPALLCLLGKWLESAGYETERARDGEQAMAAISTRCPSIVVTDWEMPRVDGLELCRWLRKQDLPNYVYTVFLTQHTGADYMVRGLEAGADDFLRKPVDKAELLARIRSGLRVLELESRLSLLARTDPLTGLTTRRTFCELMEREWSRSRRHRIPLSCVMIDIDFFKRVNDSHGHRVGDETLRRFTRVLQASCRNSDIVGRYGGEEFCVLLPETTEDNAVLWAERVRKRIASDDSMIPEFETALTASFGVAQRLEDTESPEALVDLADQSLLVAKRSGRNRVVGFRSIQDAAQIRSATGGPGAIFQGLQAKNVMTTVIAGLNENDTVGSAARYFLRFRFHSAPIVDDDGKLVGIISERDVMSVMLWPKWWETKIQKVMKRNVVCYDENTPVLTVYEFLCRVSVRGIVVVSNQRPTGMISRASLLRWFTNLLALNSTAIVKVGPAETASQGSPRIPPEPRENVALIADALRDETTRLANRIQSEDEKMLPAVIGGVSRIEELINDLLTASHYAKSVQQHEATGSGHPNGGLDTVAGIAALTESPQLPNVDTAAMAPGWPDDAPKVQTGSSAGHGRPTSC